MKISEYTEATSVAADDYMLAVVSGVTKKTKVSAVIASCVVNVNHGSDAAYARPSVDTVYWKGSVAPTNLVDGDMWYRTA